MAKDPRDEVLSLTRTELDAIISSSVETATKIAIQQTRGNAGIESTHATEEQRIHAMLGTPIPKRECLATTLYQCRNPRNGAEFVAVVVPSNKWPEGRTVRLDSYRYPSDLVKRSGKQPHPQGKYGGSHIDTVYPFVGDEGGLHGPFLPEFMQWVYDTYMKSDINAFVGQSAELLPVKPGTPPNGTPWTPEAQARLVSDANIAGDTRVG
jgi:hypothetical protein